MSANGSPSQLLYSKLINHGFDFFVSVPCKLLTDVLVLLSEEQKVFHTPVTREEEGIGIMVGAFLGGKRPAMLMQNSGFGNSINAICSLVKYYQIPLVFIVSHRGTEGEPIEAQFPMGNATQDLLQTAGVSVCEISSPSDISVMDAALANSEQNSTPIAFLFPFGFWTNE